MSLPHEAMERVAARALKLAPLLQVASAQSRIRGDLQPLLKQVAVIYCQLRAAPRRIWPSAGTDARAGCGATLRVQANPLQ